MNRIREPINSVLEIGCGAGMYPVENIQLFSGLDYTGIDISQTAIDYCKINSNFKFICDDFFKHEFDTTYNLVFSHAVIDHVSDIDNFLTKAIKLSNRYVYISTYRGFFPGIEHHMMNYDNKDGCYYNDVSVKQVERLMEKLGKSDEEYLIRAQSSGNKKTPDRMDTIIQVTKQGSVETIA